MTALTTEQIAAARRSRAMMRPIDEKNLSRRLPLGSGPFRSRSRQWVDIPATGRRYYNVNLACLEGIDIDELMAAPVTHEDGRNDRWEATPAETRHL